MQFDLVGFDLDGTLIDTAADLTAAVNHALSLDGRAPLSVAEVRPLIGGGARAMLERGMAQSGGADESGVPRLLDALLDYYEAHLAVHSRPFPGAVAALDALAARGVKLAIVTNKRETFARSLLDQLGLSARFTSILGGDTLGPGRAKPAPDPILRIIADAGARRAAFVGDSRFDIDAARVAGVPSIAVSFGFLMEPVEALGADAIIDHFEALIPTLERLG